MQFVLSSYVNQVQDRGAMSKENTIQVVHNDTHITYNEPENKWQFTLRGRDRSAESLAKAKELIDKPVPAGKAKPFEKIPAWFFGYSDTPKKVEVTGIAESPSYRRGESSVWIVMDGARTKQNVTSSIYPSSPKNDKIIAQITAKETESEKLHQEARELKYTLDPLVLPKEELV